MWLSYMVEYIFFIVGKHDIFVPHYIQFVLLESQNCQNKKLGFLRTYITTHNLLLSARSNMRRFQCDVFYLSQQLNHPLNWNHSDNLAIDISLSSF